MFHIFCSKSQGKVQNNTAPMKFLCWRPGGRKEKNEKWNQGLPPPCHPFLCYSALAAPMGLHRSSQAASVVKDLPANAGDTREASSIPGLGRSPEGGYGNPLQYSCLENLTDEGAWWAIVHGVAKGQTQQSMHKTRHGVSEIPWVQHGLVCQLLTKFSYVLLWESWEDMTPLVGWEIWLHPVSPFPPLAPPKATSLVLLKPIAVRESMLYAHDLAILKALLG